MTDEERRRTMEFILEQQAQFAANIQRHEEYFQQLKEERIRDRPLEEAFQRLDRLVKKNQARLDRLEGNSPL